MAVANVLKRFTSGVLEYYDRASGDTILAIDGPNQSVGVGSLATKGQLVVCKEVLFTQTTGNGVYTGTIVLPALNRIIDVGVHGEVVWNASTSASLIVGDAVDPDGFFLATNLNATDLLAGETNNIEHPGGLAGAYIAAEQRDLYRAATRSVIGVVTAVGTGAAGRTRLYCVYSCPIATAAVKV